MPGINIRHLKIRLRGVSPQAAQQGANLFGRSLLDYLAQHATEFSNRSECGSEQAVSTLEVRMKAPTAGSQWSAQCARQVGHAMVQQVQPSRRKQGDVK